MSSPGPDRVPSTVRTSGQGRPPVSPVQPGGRRPSGNRPGGAKGGGKGKRPVTPVKVNGGRNWAPIAVAGVVVLLAIGIIGFGVYATVKQNKDNGVPWAEQAAKISGIVDYRAQKNAQIDDRTHKDGTLTYVTNPPVGGAHNAAWQNCMGNVYTEPIANEHAVHSLEHGAIWVTYKQGLGADQVAKLAAKVENKDFTLMSPVTNLDKNVAVQAWGYQIKADNADDPRIDEFIRVLRVKASMEPGAACSSGNTSTGPVQQAAPPAGS